MKLSEIRTILATTKSDDWHVVPGFPTYRDNVNAIVDGLSELTSHYYTAVYQPDVSLTVAWGMDRPGDQNPHDLDSVSMTWEGPWPDRKISSFIVDVFYNSALVDRYTGADVDGGRAVLPYPTMHSLAPDGSVVGWTATQWQVDLFRLISDLQGLTEYDSYLARAQFVVDSG